MVILFSSLPYVVQQLRAESMPRNVNARSARRHNRQFDTNGNNPEINFVYSVKGYKINTGHTAKPTENHHINCGGNTIGHCHTRIGIQFDDQLLVDIVAQLLEKRNRFAEMVRNQEVQ